MSNNKIIEVTDGSLHRYRKFQAQYFIMYFLTANNAYNLLFKKQEKHFAVQKYR